MGDKKYDDAAWRDGRDEHDAMAERRAALATDRRERLRLFTGSPLDSTERDDPYLFESQRDRDNERMDRR